MGSNRERHDQRAPCQICKNCETKNEKFQDVNSLYAEHDNDSYEVKCRDWLEKCTINTSDGESINSSETSGASDFACSETTQDDESDIFENDGLELRDKIICVKKQEQSSIVGNTLDSANQYGDVRMKKCRKVHLGNVTKIYGSIHVTQTASTINQQSITNQLFLERKAMPMPRQKLVMIDRRSWLAQPPVEEKEYMQDPAKFVIISHTASEDGLTQAENVYLVRLTQTFHIESKKWNDIAYNFLVGCDGNIYEGRGWGVVGAHTYGYNTTGIGISFVGCFMNKLPTHAALDQAKKLIQHGIDIGAIDENYSLIGHCQCSPTESPGRKLYEEIQTWDKWNDLAKEKT